MVLDEIYKSRYLNPMFIEMEFGSVGKSILAEALTYNDDNVLVKSLFGKLREQRFMVEQLGSNRLYTPSQTKYVDQILSSGLDGLDNLNTEITFSDTELLPPRTSFDFSEWFKDTFDFYVSGVGMTPAEKFANIFRMLSLKGRVSRYLNERSRNYDEIISGVPAKSEVLGFTIDKYSIDRFGEATYVNSFHLLSNNDTEVERFIDSQVKYGQLYEYRINRVVAIAANKYTYMPPRIVTGKQFG